MTDPDDKGPGPAGIWDRYLDDDWLALVREDALEPDAPVIDPHHHLWWDRHRPKYWFDDFLVDLGAGHDVRATVYLESGAMKRHTGPEHLRAVGEVEYANGVAAMSASGGFGPTLVCAGIVGECDLTAGAEAAELLEASVAAGNGRLKGVRLNAFHDPDIEMGPHTRPDLLQAPELRDGLALLARHGLVCDVMAFTPQLPALADLAREAEGTTFIVNHLGGPLGVGAWASRGDEVRAQWRAGLAALAGCPNVLMKLGGLATPFFFNLTFRDRERPPTSEELADAYRAWIPEAIEAFGPDRCMFESNWPADKHTCGYGVLWNAFKRLAAPYSPAERHALYAGTAAAAYGLQEALSEV